jgi:hypothetical protein
LRKLFKKILPIKIHACVYILKENIKRDESQMLYDLKVFNKANKSGIKKIDAKVTGNNDCYAVFDKDILVHTSWVFKKKLLTTQLGLRNVYTVGDSNTIATYQGKGIYTNVLRMISSEKDNDIVIFVSPDNQSSVRGIEKAGFKKLYEFRLSRFLGVKIGSVKYEDKN